MGAEGASLGIEGHPLVQKGQVSAVVLDFLIYTFVNRLQVRSIFWGSWVENSFLYQTWDSLTMRSTVFAG